MDDIIDEGEILEGIVVAEDSSSYLTPGKLAKYLGISSDKLRYYSNTFEDFLSFNRGDSDKGTHRKYSPADIKTMSSIVSMCEDQQMSTKEARAQLEKAGYGVSATPEYTKLLNENAKLGEYIKNMLEVIKNDREETAALIVEMNNRNAEEIAALKSEINDLVEIIKATNSRRIKKYMKKREKLDTI